MKKTPSKLNNQFGIDYSFPGLCSYCHSEIANFDGSQEVLPGVFRPVIKSLRPEYRECVFVLDDGTRMHIALCENCDDDIEPKHMDALMESEINGWQKEVDELCPHWSEEKKISYMEKHSERSVSGRHTRPWTLKQLDKITKPRKKNLKVRLSKGV